AEPLPAMSDAQREAVRRSAAQPALRRPVRVHEPATNGRRGILPLLAATVACAALLVGVGSGNFAPPAKQTAALFDNPQSANQLLALYDSVDGLAIADESVPGELDRDSRRYSLAQIAGMEAGVQMHLRELSRESQQLRQTIVAGDGETPNV